MEPEENKSYVSVEPMKILPNEIAFDIDGVVADTFRVFVDRARNSYGYQFYYEDITEYEFRKTIDIDEQTSDEILRFLIDYPIESGIKPIRGAVEVLTRLSTMGPLFFVTARPEKASILKWIRHQLPKVDMNFIQLEATTSHTEKLPILLRNKVRYFVEDRLETCYLLEKSFITPIVFEQPWNRKFHPFPVVKGWNDISDLIEW